MAASPRLVVGIDLGTTHTLVAYAEARAGAEPRVLPIPQLVTAHEVEARALLPSCLYAPLEGEAPEDPWNEAPFRVGEYARRRGAEVPGRVVASAKSWLCHPGVDRNAPILPWGEGDDVPRVSPVEASARYLAHVRAAFDAAFPETPLAEQDVVLTVPASFDEDARELTVLSAQRAGLSVRLLEEPQAAFYDFLHRHGARELSPLLAGKPDALVLVVDVGGGTTDLSLVRARRDAGAGEPLLERIAVGRHLLLGGDNMDLALALLVEQKLVTPPSRLEPSRFGQLVQACRAAKEALLAPEPPAEVPIAIAGAGARLVGSTLRAVLTRDEVERVVLEGFFPHAPRDARPDRTRGGLVAFGLPYEREVAITRHVAAFFARHAAGRDAPDALLLNGGVFRGRRAAERLADVIGRWGGAVPRILPNDDPDLAVARGAVAYALARLGHGPRIEAGAARGYYVALDARGEAPSLVCIVPRGAPEGVVSVAEGKTFELVVGRPVRFEVFASDEAGPHRPGEIVERDPERFFALPPIATTVTDATSVAPARTGSVASTVRVALEGELTEVGTLDLACVEVEGARRRFRLAFQLRAATEDDAPRAPSTPPKGSARPAPDDAAAKREARLSEALALAERVFGRKADATPREVKDLLRDLERVLGDRPTWTTTMARGVADTLLSHRGARRRSPDHERLFWLLVGFGLRPGFGAAGDAERVQLVAPLFAERLAFPSEVRGYQQFWIAFRRVAGGLDAKTQEAIRDLVDPVLAPPDAGLKKPKKWKPEAVDDMLDMAASLERVPPPRRAALAEWLLERTWTQKDARLWAALGRLGARVPTYASAHHVVPPAVAEQIAERLLREKWEAIASAPLTAMLVTRRTDDRARDVSPRVREAVAKRLRAVAAREEWIRAVEEVVVASEAERAAFFGESLPLGLRLADASD
jgi:molecular chaperone DnaK (HSP70)